MTHSIDSASRTLLIAYDPTNGRRPDIQRLGPIVRAVGLADLLRTESVVDKGDSVQSLGPAPSSPPMATLWRDCRQGASWSSAVRRNARAVIHECEQVLAHDKLVTLSDKGWGPFRSRSARPTAAGERMAQMWRTQIRADLASDTPTAPAAALSLGLLQANLTKVLDANLDGSDPGRHLAPGLASAIRRAAQRVIVVG